MSANRRGIGRGIGKFISTVTKVIDGINAINGISEQIQNIQPKPASNPKQGNSDQFDPIQVTNPIIDQYYSSENIRRMEENMRRMANQESEADYQGGVGGGVSEEEGYYSDYQGGSDYQVGENPDYESGLNTANNRQLKLIGAIIAEQVLAPIVNEIIDSDSGEDSRWDQLSYSFLP